MSPEAWPPSVARILASTSAKYARSLNTSGAASASRNPAGSRTILRNRGYSKFEGGIMVDRNDLKQWVLEALKELSGSATLLNVIKKVWEKHRREIEVSGDLFFTWQYDIRWAATSLRKQKKMKAAKKSPRGVWELS